MTDKKKNKSTVKKASAKKTKPVEVKISEAKRKENTLSTMSIMEKSYPGITEQFLRFENEELPACPHCESKNTAKVHVGIVGRAIYLAGASNKFKLVPNSSDGNANFFLQRVQEVF